MYDSHDARAATRRSSLYAVTAVVGHRRISGKVRDHSATGCRIVLDGDLAEGEDDLIIERDGMTIGAHVAWRDGRTAGVVFEMSPPPAMFAPKAKVSPEIPAHVRFGPDQTVRRPGLATPRR